MCSPEAGFWPHDAQVRGSVESISVPGSSDMPVYVATPAGEGPWPTVLIIHDYFDPEHFYHALADHYAEEGFAAVVPHLFHRQESLPAQTHEAATERIGAVTDQGVFDDITATLGLIKERKLASGLALTGYCWGGRAAYLVAARFDDFQLILPFYGHLTAWSGPDGPKPYSPLDEAGKIHARVVGFYGETDESIPLDQVREMEAKLQAAGNRAELKIYAGMPHSFFRLQEYASTSEGAWARVLEAIRETFGKPVPA
jgi:carboxymethylenebutenolidase